MADRNPQYGFAHRVNDWDCIVDALDAGSGGGNVAGNGIEFDLGWSTFYDDWVVSHHGFDIVQPASEYLHEGLGELKKRLDTGKYNSSFAALWLDIKDPQRFRHGQPPVQEQGQPATRRRSHTIMRSAERVHYL